MRNGPALGIFLWAVVLAGAQHATSQEPPAQSQAQTPSTGDTASEKLTFDGDTALWTVAIRPDKTADFEQVLARLGHALTTSEDPLRQRQAAGWKVVRLTMPLPDGNIGYVHVLHPVVPDADYSVMRTLYDELPDERQALYELYRGAFAGNVALAVGDVVLDLGAAPTAPPDAPAAPPTPPVPPAPPHP